MGRSGFVEEDRFHPTGVTIGNHKKMVLVSRLRSAAMGLGADLWTLQAQALALDPRAGRAGTLVLLSRPVYSFAAIILFLLALLWLGPSPGALHVLT